GQVRPLITDPSDPPHRLSGRRCATLPTDRGSALVCPPKADGRPQCPIVSSELFDNLRRLAGVSIASFLICHPEAARRSKATERNEGPRACVRQKNVSGNSHCAPGIVFPRQADDSKLIRTSRLAHPRSGGATRMKVKSLFQKIFRVTPYNS